jgi:small ubiquitin-related modifier
MSTLASVQAENSDEENSAAENSDEEDTGARPSMLKEFITLVVTDEEGRRLTRTMRTTDKLQDLIDYYYAIVPIVKAGKGSFEYKAQQQGVAGWHTPVDLKMKDGDEIHFYFFPVFDLVTPVLQDFRGRRFTRTMRRTDKMQGLMDFYYDMVPAVAIAHDDGGAGGIFLYRGECIAGDQTPADLQLKHFDMIYFVPRRRGDVVEEKPGSFVTLYVTDEQNKVYLTMRRTDKLKVLLDVYRDKVPTGWWGGRFARYGKQLNHQSTPADHDMMDGDELDFFSRIIY